MKKANKTKTSKPSFPANGGGIVGSFLMAFGQGVSPLRVHRTTVVTLQTTMQKSVHSMLARKDWNAYWETDAASVLGFMAAVGRLAAHRAMSESRTVIVSDDFLDAFKAVKAQHAPTPAGTRWCPSRTP